MRLRDFIVSILSYCKYRVSLNKHSNDAMTSKSSNLFAAFMNVNLMFLENTLNTLSFFLGTYCMFIFYTKVK